MPVHGEWRHLRADAASAVNTGVAEESVVLADDGVVVDLVDGKASVTGKVEVGRVYVDGLSVGDIGESTLGDPRAGVLGDALLERQLGLEVRLVGVAERDTLLEDHALEDLDDLRVELGARRPGEAPPSPPRSSPGAGRSRARSSRHRCRPTDMMRAPIGISSPAMPAG